jgi:hypothetical protein
MAMRDFLNAAKQTDKIIDQKTITNSGKMIDAENFEKSEFDEVKEKLNNSETIKNEDKEYNIPKIIEDNGDIKPKIMTDSEINYAKPKINSEKIESSSFSTSQRIGKEHCNIVANVIKQSGATFKGNTTWQNCKFLKTTSGMSYCTEFYSLCGKDKCKRATQ